MSINNPIRNIFKWLLITTLMIFSAGSSYSQKKSIRFQHFTIENGLPQNMVDCIWEDSKGFMWFGTWNGICRFDGYTFKEFSEENKNSGNKFNNFIYSISEDKYSNIWVGTDAGLAIFIYNQNRFKYFDKLALKLPVISDQIRVITSTGNGNIWLGGKQGLAEYKPVNDTAQLQLLRQIKFGHERSEIPGDVIYCISETKDGSIWIGTNEGISIIPKKQNSLLKMVNVPGLANSIPNNSVRAIFEDSKGDIWIGTDNGVSIYNKKTGQYRNYFYSPFSENSLVHNSITSIVEDNKGNIIIGTLGGLSIFAKEFANEITNYTSQPNSEYELNNDFINCLLVDRRGNIWIGTERGGINKYNSNQNEFEYFETEVNNPNSLSKNTINSILEDDEYIWIGTAGGGLNRYTKSTGKFLHLMNSPSNPTSIPNNFVTSFCKDNQNNLWVGTWGGGLNKISGVHNENPAFVILRSQIHLQNSLSNDFISSLLLDKQGQLWIGTLGGLDRYDPVSGKFVHFEKEVEGKRITQVGCLIFDSKNNLWVGTRIGLYKIEFGNDTSYNIQNSQVTVFNHQENNPKSISGDYIISLLNDSKGNIWIGTYGNGLNLLISDQKDGIFEHFTKQNGLSNNVIYTILEDNHNNLWLTTDYGLSRLNPDNKKFRNFYAVDGLQNNQYYWSASYKNKSGKLYVGGMNGLNSFYPEWISETTYHPKVVFTDFKIFNESVKVGTKYNGRIVLEKNITETDEITISYKSNEFLFEFSALDFEQSELNEYAYKLEGFDKDWIYIGATRRFANYTNLEPDEYVFKVRTTNNKGEWTEIPTVIKITIIPPFWKTWWFRLILGVSIIALIIGYNRYRIFALKQQKRKLELQVKQRTIEIKEQNEKLEEQNKMLADKKELIEGQNQRLEVQNEEILAQRDKLIELNKKVTLVNQYKLRFFTNVSHEFRTPLTLILGPIEKLLQETGFDEITRNTLSLINRNAQRLLHLINQLMEFRKIEKGKMDLKISKTNVCDFIKDIANAFNDIAKQKKINFSVDFVNINRANFFDPEKVENILFNLLSNAFKYTGDNGKIWVKVYFQKEEDCPEIIKHLNIGPSDQTIVFEVGDTGKGIEQEVLPHIFNRFYRGEDQSHNVTSSGIGLSLAKELVKIHHGKIRVSSQTGVGTTFYVMLPVSKDSYPDDSFTEKFHTTTSLQKQVDNLFHEFMHQKKLGDHLKEPLKVIRKRPTILIAEDNADLREFLAIKLNENYNILEAENGKIAYDLAVVQDPSIIISDIMMPKMDGIELCRSIKENIATSHIPIILLTAKNNIEDRIEGLESGADDYLAKPFNFSILEARVNNLIESRRKLFSLIATKIELEPAEVTNNSIDERFLKAAIELIESNLDNPGFGVTDLISKMNMSRSTLHKKFTALTNQSTVDFINNLRLKKSISLLKNSGLNISEVAYSVGYNDPKYYSRIFKKVFGKTPTEFQKEFTEL